MFAASRSAYIRYLSHMNTDKKPSPSSSPHHSMIDIMKQAFAVPKAEIDRREKEWQKTTHKRGRPKKDKKP